MQDALFGTTPYRQASSSYRSRFKTIGVCEICGKVFRTKAKAGEPQRTCGRDCGIELRRREGKLVGGHGELDGWTSKVPWRSCKRCGTRFINRRLTGYCGDPCEPEGYVPVPMAESAECEHCGKTFLPERCGGRFKTRFCSLDCGKRFQERLHRHRRRAAGTGERFGLLEIAERDGWRCHICGKRVTKKNWSMDHLIPVAPPHNGPHRRDNVALAHHYCNSLRGVGRLPAQLLLVG